MQTADSYLRPLPHGFPDDFEVTDRQDGGCPIQMHSPSTGAFTLLRVERPGGVGDYHVDPVNAPFVLGDRDLVRFNSATVRALGVVTWYPYGA